MDALLSHCVRACGTPIDASLSPAPSVLCEDGRGVLYALGADGTIRCSLARHVNASLRFAVDENEVNPSVTPNGAGSFRRRAVEVFKPNPPIDFEPRTLSVSPSGRFAVIGGLRHSPESSVPASSACAVVSLRSPGETEETTDDPDDPTCATVDLLSLEFGTHHALRVLRQQWHPQSDSHLLLLLSDGTLRVFDAATNLATHETAFELDPWGRGVVHNPLRPEIVDFQFAPAHGWGAFSLILLGRYGDLYTLCPFAPNGARYSAATVAALVSLDTKTETWLHKTFPALRRSAERSSTSTQPFPNESAASPSRIGLCTSSDEDEVYDSDDDGRGDGNGRRDDDDDSNVWAGSSTYAAQSSFFDKHAEWTPGLRGPLPLGTDSVDGDGDGSYGVCGRNAVARCLAVAPFVAGEGGGALLAVAHQRANSTSDHGSGVAATLDVLILPQEPSPGWARRLRTASGDAGDTHDNDTLDGPPIQHTPLVDDDDEGSLPPLLAIDRITLVGAHTTQTRGSHQSRHATAANELAPFVFAMFDPGSRERVFCGAGGAVHAVTLTWLSQVEGAVDDDDDDLSSGPESSFAPSANCDKRLPLPTVITLLDSPCALLGVAPVGDPLAEGLVLAIDVTGNAVGLHPAPPLPPDSTDETGTSSSSSSQDTGYALSLAAAAEASAELNALSLGPGDFRSAVPVASGSDLKPGTVEGNAALARAATELKEKHLRFAHRVHAATRRHGVRLGVEVQRQRGEAAVIRQGLQAVSARREALARRLERAKTAHTASRERLRKLAELEQVLPRPATAAESAFRTTLRATQDDAPFLRAKLDELRRRCENLSVDENNGVANGASHSDSADAAVREELKSQQFAIRRNAERARALQA